MMKSKFSVYTALVLIITLNSCDESIDPSPIVSDVSSSYVFTSDEGEKFEVWKSIDNELTQLTFKEDKDSWWPQVNKQGSSILFYESNQSRTVNDYTSAALQLMNLDGSNKKELISLGSANQFVQQGLASWSYSGNFIVFSALEVGQEYWQLYELNLNSSELRRISTNYSKNYLDPIYNIDDSRIYCVTNSDSSSADEKNDVFELELETGAETRITSNNTRDHHPCLSPDGRKLLFESLVDEDYLGIGKWEIRSYDFVSKTESRLIEDENIRLFPHFSSDGNTVYFTELLLETASLGIGAYKIDSQELESLQSNGNNAMNVSPF
jgi:Tol biopolymer transport system component